jgi:hypothetical protein
MPSTRKDTVWSGCLIPREHTTELLCNYIHSSIRAGNGVEFLLLGQYGVSRWALAFLGKETSKKKERKKKEKEKEKKPLVSHLSCQVATTTPYHESIMTLDEQIE